MYTITRRILDFNGNSVHIGAGLVESPDAIIYHTRAEAEAVFDQLDLGLYWEIIEYVPANG